MSSSRRAFGTIRKLPSGRYQASYIGPDSRRHVGWSTYLVKADAEVWLRDEEILIDRAQWTAPSRRLPVEQVDGMTLREYATANIRRRATRARKPIRPTTVDLYNKLLDLAILPTLGNKVLVDISPADVQRWHDSLPATPTQNGAAYQLFRSLMADALEDEMIERNPVRIKGAGKPAPKRTGIALNIGELGAYTSAARHHALPLLLCAWCSLRSGEVRGLRRCDVADDGTALRVEQIVTQVGRHVAHRAWLIGPPKTAAGKRRAAVPPHLQPLLKAWLDAYTGAPTGLLFAASDGTTPIHEGVLRRAHKEAAIAIGRPALTLHDLRRTGATLAGQSGATTKELMSRLGHTQPAMAMIYQVADQDRDDQVAKRMSAMLGAS